VLKVGLTGGIGSGKSTVAQVFSLLGVPVYYADQRAQALIESDSVVREGIINLLGQEAYDLTGAFNRKLVAEMVFANTNLLTGLNEIVHPAVRTDFIEWANRYTGHPYVIQEAAILIESGGSAGMDAIILVWAPEELRLQRVVERDGSSESEVRARMQHQMQDVDKVRKSHYVVINDGKHSIMDQITDIHTAICYQG
jgi:dephospho-CoA kinase